MVSASDIKRQADCELAVAVRARLLIPRAPRYTEDHDYSGRRTDPERLGPRFRQRTWAMRGMGQVDDRCGLCAVPPETIVADIELGKWDRQILAAWHDAAGATFHYRYTDYGEDDIEPALPVAIPSVPD
jgi:hypothetical protein